MAMGNKTFTGNKMHSVSGATLKKFTVEYEWHEWIRASVIYTMTYQLFWTHTNYQQLICTNSVVLVCMPPNSE